MSDRELAASIDRKYIRFFILYGCSLFLAVLVIGLLWGPIMKPWTQERLGKANLAQSRYDNLIRAEAAKAEEEAAVLRAKAIAIVGEAAQKFPEYRNQEFIGGFAAALEAGKIPQIFYIPTRNSIPLLPAFAGNIDGDNE